MVVQAETKRSRFADFKEWTESGVASSNERCPELEQLESEHISVLKERAGTITHRRKEDGQDNLFAVYCIPAQRDSSTDELGRTVPRADPVTLRKVRRVARVARRKYRRSRNALSEGDWEEEGYSTDSSFPSSDAQDYRAAIHRMAIGGEELLSDVAAAEFRDPSLGLSKWFELLGWNPLDKSSNSSSWYSTLHEYSQSYDQYADAETSEPPPGGDLVSAMISTAVFPPFRTSLESRDFDPYSGRDVKRVVDAAE
ncbi:hypothetical protein F5141DRAFT_1213574 [Pisolithus sp. B1]|nr:hypothetical protein F5141DRAFT_1213574 [Pisolithus sp. B1]